jgi:hypothetical protein
MVNEDLRAVKRFLLGEHNDKRLNIRKMAIVAPEMSAPIAVQFAVMDWAKEPHQDAPIQDINARTPRGQDVRALILISPVEKVPGIDALGKSAMTISRLEQKGRRELPDFDTDWRVACMVVFGSGDVRDKGTSRRVYKKLAGPSSNKDRMYLFDYPLKLRGTDLVDPKIDIEAKMLAFLELHVKDLPDPWQDRRSRLNRGK